MAVGEFRKIFTEDEWNELKNDKTKYYRLYRRFKKHGNIHYRKAFDYNTHIEKWDELDVKEKKKYYDIIKIKRLYDKIKNDDILNI